MAVQKRLLYKGILKVEWVAEIKQKASTWICIKRLKRGADKNSFGNIQLIGCSADPLVFSYRLFASFSILYMERF